MALQAVVEKSTGRLVFVRDATIPMDLTAVWSPVDHNYVILANGTVPQGAFATPYAFSFSGRTLNAATITEDAARPYQQKWALANLVLHVGRAIARHRLLVTSCSPDQHLVHALKIEEANALVSGLATEDKMPFLQQDAALDGITVRQAADLVRFRAQQQFETLLTTENARRRLMKRVLSAQPSEYDTVEQEITHYEQTAEVVVGG